MPGTGEKADRQIDDQADCPDKSGNALAQGGFGLVRLSPPGFRRAALLAAQNDQHRCHGHKAQGSAQTVDIHAHAVQNDEGQGTEDVKPHGNGTQQFPHWVIGAILLGWYLRLHRCLRLLRTENFVDIPDAADGQTVGSFRGFSGGNEIVVPIQGVLQDFLPDVLAVGGTGK